MLVITSLVSISGESKRLDKPNNKVSVIGGGDLGMATVMSILSKVYVEGGALTFHILQFRISMYNSIVDGTFFFCIRPV